MGRKRSVNYIILASLLHISVLFLHIYKGLGYMATMILSAVTAVILSKLLYKFFGVTYTYEISRRDNPQIKRIRLTFLIYFILFFIVLYLEFKYSLSFIHKGVLFWLVSYMIGIFAATGSAYFKWRRIKKGEVA